MVNKFPIGKVNFVDNNFPISHIEDDDNNKKNLLTTISIQRQESLIEP